MIGIIIINYNGYADTEECIASLQNGSYNNIKIYIVDNASCDSDRNHLKKVEATYNNVTVIFNDANLGFSLANNVGAEKAIQDGVDYISFLNNDTIVSNDFFSKLVEHVENGKRIYTCKMMYYTKPDTIWFAGGDYSFAKGTAYHDGVNKKDSAEFSNDKYIKFATGCFWLLSSDDYRTLGGWPEEFFLYSEDCDFSLSAIEKGFKIKYIGDVVLYHKVSASTKKLTNISAYYIMRNRLIVIHKHHKGIFKITAFCYTALVAGKAIVKKRMSFETVRRAWKDYFKKKWGKYSDG